MSETISKTLLQQRCRNRMIDVLEIASSFEDIARFGSYEVINLWEDWYHGLDTGIYAEPVFSPEEARQIAALTLVWDETAEVDEAEHSKPEQLSALVHWQRFRTAAEEALAVFDKRGRFSEEQEVF